ncbi:MULTISPECIES: STAS domain-containing protein [unclassified Streptomyces]|uniref:STAS domain-containing protein n=1 Tax=unclassified Streptomyces TaxID=2593676 RepID=UPI003403F419
MNVTTELNGHSATVTPHGDLDFEQLDHLYGCIRRLPPAITEIRWDLHAVPFMTIAGLHLLDTRTTRLHVTVVNPAPQPLHLLELAGEMFSHLGWDQRLAHWRRAEAA